MPTLIRPPPVNDKLSQIENVLELTELTDIDPDLFTNTRPMWHPPGARGIFGGAAIAQTLSAAQKTVPSDFTVHSMHCYFVLAGNAEIPILYHVERVRSGKSFATRTVQARQRGKVIFTTTMSFVRQNSGGENKVEHTYPMPDVPDPEEGMDDLDSHGNETGPFQSQRLAILNGECFQVLPTIRIPHTAELTSSRRFALPSHQEVQTVDESTRHHLSRRRTRSSPLCHRLHVRQLLHRYHRPCTQALAILDSAQEQVKGQC